MPKRVDKIKRNANRYHRLGDKPKAHVEISASDFEYLVYRTEQCDILEGND